MSKAKKTTLSSDEHKLIIAYIAANLIYDNGQRPAVVQNMTISEYKKRLLINDTEIIQVAKHKSSVHKGPAKIVISSKTIMNLLQQYYVNIRQCMQAANDELNKRFFLLPTGMEVRKVYELMNSVALRFGTHLPTPTTHRKVIASEAPQYLSKEDVTLLQDYMSHSKYTAETYYQKTTVTAALHSHDNIKRLTNKRQGFSSKEDLKILKEWPLSSDAGTPPLTLCRLISSKYNIDKSPQKIQDRWKYLYKKHNIA